MLKVAPAPPPVNVLHGAMLPRHGVQRQLDEALATLAQKFDDLRGRTDGYAPEGTAMGSVPPGARTST